MPDAQFEHYKTKELNLVLCPRRDIFELRNPICQLNLLILSAHT